MNLFKAWSKLRFLAGKVKKSLIDFQGAGNKSAIKLLQDCLRSNLARLKFTPELQNEVIRFNLFLNLVEADFL